MSKAGDAFDAAVTATLDAAVAAYVAGHVAGEIAADLTRLDRTPPPDLEAIVRCSLCPALEPRLDPTRSRAQLAALVDSVDRPTPRTGAPYRNPRARF